MLLLRMRETWFNSHIYPIFFDVTDDALLFFTNISSTSRSCELVFLFMSNGRVVRASARFVSLFSYSFNSSNGRVVRASVSGAVGLGLIPSRVKPMTLKLYSQLPCLTLSIKGTPTACHRCDISSELCCPGTKPRRWTRHSLHASA